MLPPQNNYFTARPQSQQSSYTPFNPRGRGSPYSPIRQPQGQGFPAPPMYGREMEVPNSAENESFASDDYNPPPLSRQSGSENV